MHSRREGKSASLIRTKMGWQIQGTPIEVRKDDGKCWLACSETEHGERWLRYWGFWHDRWLSRDEAIKALVGVLKVVGPQ